MDAMLDIARLKPGRDWRGKYTCYRLHLADPVPSTKSIRISIEHGHANCLSNDMYSVAYWCQLQPHRDFASMPPASKRAPAASASALALVKRCSKSARAESILPTLSCASLDSNPNVIKP